MIVTLIMRDPEVALQARYDFDLLRREVDRRFKWVVIDDEDLGRIFEDNASDPREALVAAISVVELTYTAQRYIGSTYKPFEMFLMSGILYMVIIYVTGRAVTWLDNKAKIV